MAITLVGKIVKATPTRSLHCFEIKSSKAALSSQTPWKCYERSLRMHKWWRHLPWDFHFPWQFFAIMLAFENPLFSSHHNNTKDTNSRIHPFIVFYYVCSENTNFAFLRIVNN